MIKEITKIEKVDSSEVAECIVDCIIDCIDYETRKYLEQRHNEILDDDDIEDILADDTWWNALLKDLMDEMKC